MPISEMKERTPLQTLHTSKGRYANAMNFITKIYLSSSMKWTHSLKNTAYWNWYDEIHTYTNLIILDNLPQEKTSRAYSLPGELYQSSNQHKYFQSREGRDISQLIYEASILWILQRGIQVTTFLLSFGAVAAQVDITVETHKAGQSGFM